jgi:hypothetical protein
MEQAQQIRDVEKCLFRDVESSFTFATLRAPINSHGLHKVR